MKDRILCFLLFWVLLQSVKVGAQGAYVRSTKPLSSATIRVPRIDRAPRLEDFTGMLPNSEWQGKLAVVSDFVQRNPDDGQPATERTEAYLGYDARALHIIFVAHDRAPDKVRARMDHRESIATDEDQVGIYIDTFRDHRRAYEFICNALGVQDDALYSEDADSSDGGFDTIWNSKGKLTNGGYVVLMSIPFKSLRFAHENSQTWNVALWRFLGRRSENSWWPRVSGRERGILSQSAVAAGIENISPGRNLQITPYASWRAFHTLDRRDPRRSTFSNRSAEVLAGLDTKLILKDSMVLDLTVRPDFSQVESDEAQLSTNQRYEIFYPEKRPFFTENSSYFEVPMVVPSQHMLFMRRIADPNFGARLTGRLGKYSIGSLFADDRSPGERVPSADPLSGKRAYYDVFRVTRDLPSRSNAGVTFAERRFEGSYSRVVDFDTTFNLGRTWKGTVMTGYSWNRALDGTTDSGGDLDATLTRVSRGFNYMGYFVNRARGFQPAMAYYDHSNWREIGQTFAYQFWPTNNWITRVWTEVYAAQNRHFNGDLNWEGIKPTVKADIKHNTTLTSYVWIWRNAFGPQDFKLLNSIVKFPVVPAYGMQLSSTQSRLVSFKVAGEWGTRSNEVPAAGQPPTQARYRQGEADLSILMPSGLSITNTYLFDSNRALDGRAIYDAHIARSRWNFQVNRKLSFRFIAQYNAVLSNPKLTATPLARGFNADFLMTYLVHPGTALYAGYNSNLSNPGPATGTAAPNRFVNDGRQVFVKLSYMFRF